MLGLSHGLPKFWGIGIIARLAVICAVLFAVTGCAMSQAGRQAPLSKRAPPTILQEKPQKIGGVVAPGSVAQVALLTPLTAPRSDAQYLARSLERSAQLALSDIRGAKLMLDVYDTRGSAEGAKAAAQKAVEDGADILVGPLFGHGVNSVRLVANAAGLSLFAFSNDTSVAGDGAYLLGFLVGDEVARVMTFAAAKGMSRMAALAPDSKLGDIGVAAFQESSVLNQVDVAAIERYPLDFSGIEEAARRYADIHKQQVDPISAVMIADRGQSLQAIAAFLDYFNVSPEKTKFFGPGLWQSESTLKEVALRGGWLAAPDPRVINQFNRRYQATYKEKPHPLASLGYDAMAAVGALAADAAARGDDRPFSPDNITTPAGFVGVNGVFRLKPNGLNERALAVLEVRPEGFAVIDPAPAGFVGN
jgi:ABC-type branched-subunit amino acid transport system substrate-binding protein